MVAVGFNPRAEAGNARRRVATLERHKTSLLGRVKLRSTVATRRVPAGVPTVG